MADLLSLSFEMHTLIVRNLCLRDCAEVANVSHDALYYVFAHRAELDFSSLVENSNSVT